MGLTADVCGFQKCPNFIIVDAGGGTIDISAYRQNPAEDTQTFEEIAPAQCKHECYSLSRNGVSEIPSFIYRPFRRICFRQYVREAVFDWYITSKNGFAQRC